MPSILSIVKLNHIVARIFYISQSASNLEIKIESYSSKIDLHSPSRFSILANQDLGVIVTNHFVM